MSNNEQLTEKQRITREALEADRLWSEAIIKTFGKGSEQKRYTAEGEGIEGSELRKAYEKRMTTYRAWLAYTYGE